MEFGMEYCKPVTMPMEPGKKIIPTDNRETNVGYVVYSPRHRIRRQQIVIFQ